MTEFDIQCAGVAMVRAYMQHRWPDYCLVLDRKKNGSYIEAPLYHVENEGKRNPRVAANAKRMGMVPGVWDLTLDVKRNGFGCLKIEVKKGNAKLTQNQKQWEEHYIQQGYKTKVCRTAQEILSAVREYMEGDIK